MASPLQKFNAENRERWNVLVDMPEWIKDPVVDWITGIYYSDIGSLRTTTVDEVQRRMRIMLRRDTGMPIGDSRTTFIYNLEHSFEHGNVGALLLLDVTVKYVRDYAPSSISFHGSTVSDSDLLDFISGLLSNGSKWKVVRDNGADSGIIERVDQLIVDQAHEIDEDHLTRAWNNAFQLKPDPERAIEEAQKAIESVASKMGLTKLTTGVYGGIIGDIKAHPDRYANAAFAAYELHDTINNTKNGINALYSQWFAITLDLIQKTHPARHKSSATSEFKLSTEAAQQSVVMATALCWLITKQYFKKANSR